MKNLLVFAAPLCGGMLTDMTVTLRTCIGFAAFCFMSSAVYTINDIIDADRDRFHPTKKNRPVASGRVGPVAAIGVCGVCFAVSAFFAAMAAVPVSFCILAAYMIINVLYAIWLKHVPLMDITSLASGFMLRIAYGGVVSGVSISDWLYLTAGAMSCWLAFGKRRGELRRYGSFGTRPVLEAYSDPFLSKATQSCLTAGLVFYAVWSIEAGMLLTVPVIFLIAMRYSMIAEGDVDGDPVETLLGDRVLLAMCAVYGVMMLALLYLTP